MPGCRRGGAGRPGEHAPITAPAVAAVEIPIPDTRRVASPTVLFGVAWPHQVVGGSMQFPQRYARSKRFTARVRQSGPPPPKISAPEQHDRCPEPMRAHEGVAPRVMAGADVPGSSSCQDTSP